MIATELIQDVKVFNGNYTPAEAKTILMGMIDKQINFYKSQYLSHWEKNHNTGKEYLDQKINELKTKKAELAAVIREAKSEGRNIILGGAIELSFAD